jgi:hypothetical protein
MKLAIAKKRFDRIDREWINKDRTKSTISDFITFSTEDSQIVQTSKTFKLMDPFVVHSALGRCRFTPSKSPTPLTIPARSAAVPLDAEPLPAHERVRKQNEQLAQLKEQYLQLREQFKAEQKESSAKLLELQREIRAEQKRVEELEDQLGSHARTEESTENQSAGAMEAIEHIWQLMQEYRDAVHPSKGREKKLEIQSAVPSAFGGTTPNVAGARPEQPPKRMPRF